MNKTMSTSLTKRVACISLAGLFAFSVALAPVAIQPQQAEAASVAKQLKKQSKKFVKKAGASKGAKQDRLAKVAACAVQTFTYGRDSKTMAQDAKARSGAKGWWKKSAVSMFKTGKGSCYSDAAAVAVAAKKATGYTVRVAAGKARSLYWNPATTNEAVKTEVQFHAWAEVKVGGTWYVYDANLDRNATDSKGAGKYIGVTRDSVSDVYNGFNEVKYQKVKL